MQDDYLDFDDIVVNENEEKKNGEASKAENAKKGYVLISTMKNVIHSLITNINNKTLHLTKF
jgi:hypothetical protein